ncbi:SDR family NAD(P)-dependent oxidoreductase [Dyadobacter sp. 3J3]|uniref:SDR family NAD(P)-dependent oxidoreductase n=1 Tax=Dyadobacter sp. 3J3 TaxID=2606600 RepID=UPI001358AE75|nr:SDR family NAD(P)-dependent oxidoreductase [Dyadobacter sp. 3J3]
MKTIVITGGNSGLGLETAKILATDKNNQLILGCRNQSKALAAVEELKKISGNDHIQTLELDLSSFTSIRNFAEKVLAVTKNIDVLACNAGIQITKGTQITAEGFEKTFGVNHLGHFLLTKLLLPSINKVSGRIVLVSSGTHFNPAIWQSSMFGIPPADYTGWENVSAANSFKNYPEKNRGYVRYSTSKLCVLFFGYELEARLKQNNMGITVNIFDPGLMPGTELARDGSALEIWAWKNIMPVMRIFDGVFSVKTSAKNFSNMLTGNSFEKISGKYYEGPKEKKSSDDSYNKTFWNDLWKGSESLIKETFEIQSVIKSVSNS